MRRVGQNLPTEEGNTQREAVGRSVRTELLCAEVCRSEEAFDKARRLGCGRR